MATVQARDYTDCDFCLPARNGREPETIYMNDDPYLLGFQANLGGQQACAASFLLEVA